MWGGRMENYPQCRSAAGSLMRTGVAWAASVRAWEGVARGGRGCWSAGGRGVGGDGGWVELRSRAAGAPEEPPDARAREQSGGGEPTGARLGGGGVWERPQRA